MPHRSSKHIAKDNPAEPLELDAICATGSAPPAGTRPNPAQLKKAEMAARHWREPSELGKQHQRQPQRRPVGTRTSEEGKELLKR
jgi:hypothetical protein